MQLTLHHFMTERNLMNTRTDAYQALDYDRKDQARASTRNDTYGRNDHSCSNVVGRGSSKQTAKYDGELQH